MVAFLLFIGSFVFFLLSLSGTVPAYRDSGDMINAIYTFGIAHPPGYPLYILLGKIFTTLLPFGNVAYRVNTFSAFCAALSVALVFLVARYLLHTTSEKMEMNKVWVRCVAVAAMYGWSPAVLSLSKVAEMYALSVCFAGGIILCWAMNTTRSLWLGSFLLGCGFGVHPTLLLLAPLLVPFPLRQPKDEPPIALWKSVGSRLGYFFLGFSVVLFLLVRAKTGPLQNWGDPTTLEGVWRMITRSNYGGFKLHPVESQFSWTLESLSAQLLYFVRTLGDQWGWLAVGLGVLGLGVSLRTGAGLVICWLLAGPGFFVLSNLPLQENTTAPILEPYLVLVNFIWALWVAKGIYSLFQAIKQPRFQVVAWSTLIAMCFVLVRQSYVSQRQDFYTYDLGRNLMRTLPNRAVMYDPDDPIAFTLRTLQLTENRREDIVLLNFYRTLWGYRQIVQRWPDLLPPIPVRNAQELEQLFWTYSIQQRPFYADLPVKIPAPLSYRIEGLLYPIQTQPASSSARELARSDQFFNFYVWRGDWRTTEHLDFFTQHIFNYYASARCNLGLKYAERHDWAQAVAHYRLALCIDPHLAAAYNDLGVVFFNQHQWELATQNYQLALQYDPNNPGFRQNLDLTYQSKGQIPQVQVSRSLPRTPSPTP